MTADRASLDAALTAVAAIAADRASLDAALDAAAAAAARAGRPFGDAERSAICGAFSRPAVAPRAGAHDSMPLAEVQKLIGKERSARREQQNAMIEATGQAIGKIRREIEDDFAKTLAVLGQRIATIEAATKARGTQYRGVYKAGEVYNRGDFVTDGGSLWHCDVEQTAERPSKSSDWTLAVKRGRDGRDATK